MFAFFNGKKTYIVAIATLAYAAFGLISGNLDWNQAANLIFGAGGLAALRNGQTAETEKVLTATDVQTAVIADKVDVQTAVIADKVGAAK